MQMCRMADRWQATSWLQACFDSLIEQDCEEDPLFPEWVQHITSVLALKPGDSPWHKAVQETLLPRFYDVHLLLTSESLLAAFLQLLYALVHAWASSDSLTVDSEISVAVALSAWAAGPVGTQSCLPQLQGLSELLRLRHLTTRKYPLET
jgi:hypothetical protein